MKALFAQFRAHQKFAIVVVFFVFAFVNLLGLPIFNDEAVYLDWAWANTHIPGNAFVSLIDGKQPLLFWIFGVSERLFSNPLFAGRIVSVVVGAVGVLGIYSIGKRVFDERVAVLSSLFYIVTPILLFYNRQALMEASIAVCGIWSCRVLIELIHKPTWKNATALGAILGLGFFIKTSSIVFVIAACCIGVYAMVRRKDWGVVGAFCLALFAMFLVDFVVLMEPSFWQSLSLNTRQVFVLSELLKFPIFTWITSLAATLNIGFFFFTPVLFLTALVGMVALRKSSQKVRVLWAFSLISLVIEIIMVRSQNQRYLVAYLPLFVLPAAYACLHVIKKRNIRWRVTALALGLPAIASMLMTLFPTQYLRTAAKLTPYANAEYLYGQTSGYELNEVIAYLQSQSRDKFILVGTGLNIGNPESAVSVAMNENPHAVSVHMDATLLAARVPDFASYDCIASTTPVYFVSRNQELSGLEKYFMLDKSFHHPYSDYAVDVYKLKEQCVGKTFQLLDLYQPAIQEIQRIRQF